MCTNRETRRSIAFGDVHVGQYDNGTVLLDKLVGAQLERVVRPNRLLQLSTERQRLPHPIGRQQLVHRGVVVGQDWDITDP